MKNLALLQVIVVLSATLAITSGCTTSKKYSFSKKDMYQRVDTPIDSITVEEGRVKVHVSHSINRDYIHLTIRGKSNTSEQLVFVHWNIPGNPFTFFPDSGLCYYGLYLDNFYFGIQEYLYPANPDLGELKYIEISGYITKRPNSKKVKELSNEKWERDTLKWSKASI